MACDRTRSVPTLLADGALRQPRRFFADTRRETGRGAVEGQLRA